METCNAVLTFESVDKVLWCDPIQMKPLPPSGGSTFAWYHLLFNILQNEILDFS